METFHLTRSEMSMLLLSLKGWNDKKPLTILQEVWAKSHQKDIESGQSVTAFITTALPPIFEKIIKIEETDLGFSLNEIVALGNQIENTNFSITAMQNWVKRDIKEMVGSPQRGKKYSIEQIAILFIVEDLKTALDFESIRKLLALIVNDPADRSDDLINPVHLYATYSSLFEELNKQENTSLQSSDTIHTMEEIIKERADELAGNFMQVSNEQREAIRNVIIIATLSVYTAYVQRLAKRYVSATLFLQQIYVTPKNDD
jgi:Domain of unknown function (DUF1836)